MRSGKSWRRGSGPPGLHVKPGRFTGVGWTSRYESTKPASANALLAGHFTAYGTSGRALAAAGVQSRYDGLLKSPVNTTGMPLAASGRSAWMVFSIAGSLSDRSRSSTRCRLHPFCALYGPYGVDGRWVLAIATTRPGLGSMNT